MRFLIGLIIVITIIQTSSAHSQEAWGLVTHVTDGDTITVENWGIIRLADVNSPEMDVAGGPEAKEYTRNNLLGKTVSLDIDNTTGFDKYGRRVAVVWIIDEAGKPGINFNKMLVDAGHARVQDARDNEFDPKQWWQGSDQGANSNSFKFIGSLKSNKYHYPDCRWAEKITPENAVYFKSSEDARSKGYIPCGVCKPL